MQYLTEKLWFPQTSQASDDGLLAIGGDLTPERLLLAYQNGIFPWYEDGQPILWWSPNKRMVLFPDSLKVSKSLRKLLRSEKYKITFNNSFSEVIKNCSEIKRQGQAGTWITSEMQLAYIKLHELGHAKSVEVWRDSNLVGGLYGIDLPDRKVFCGESMFSLEANTSKIALVTLIKTLVAENYRLVDCQVYTKHLETLGAQEILRKEFEEYL